MKKRILISAGVLLLVVAILLLRSPQEPEVADPLTPSATSSELAPAAAPEPASAAYGRLQNPNVILHSGSPSGLLQKDGAILVADAYHKAVWSVVPGAEPERLAGREGVRDIANVPVGGYHDAALGESAFQSPWAIAAFLDGTIVSDPANHVLRYFGREQVYTAVGNGTPGYREGFGVEALFNSPTGVAADDVGNLYIADTGNHRIRMLDPNGNTSLVAGGDEGCADGAAAEARFRSPTGLCWSGGALYVADTGNHRIVKIQDGVVTTVAGSSKEAEGEAFYHGGYQDGAAGEAAFSHPQGVAVDQNGALYIADTGNSAIRKMSGGQVTTLLRDDPSSEETYPIAPRGLLIDGGTLYIADTFAGVVFRETLSVSRMPAP